MSSAMLWGPGELGRDKELCIPSVARCDNSCLLRKMERWFRAKHAAGNKNIQVWTGAVLHFYKCYSLLLCLGYLAMGLCYGGLQRGWLEMAFGVLFIYSWICLQWILSLCKFKDLLLSPPSVSPKVTLHKKASSQMVSVYFYYFFFNYCFVGPMLGGRLPCFFWGLRVLPACVCLPLPCGQRCESWSNFLLPTFHLASQIFACVAFEILVIVCGHWWVFESACVHLPPGVMMCRNVRSVTPLPDLSDSRALRDFTTISCNIMATIS